MSAITVGELALGVQRARDPRARARRQATLAYVQASFEPLVIDASVAHTWASLVSALRDAGRRVPVNDSWIAATAIAHDAAVLTGDDDYDAMPGVRVIRV